MCYVVLVRSVNTTTWIYAGQWRKASQAAKFGWRQAARGLVVRIVVKEGRRQAD